MDRVQLEQVSEFKYLEYVLDESNTDVAFSVIEDEGGRSKKLPSLNLVSFPLGKYLTETFVDRPWNCFRSWKMGDLLMK